MIINLAKIRFGGGAPAKPEDFFEKSYTANGAYDITPEAGHVFSGGHVEVDVHPTESLSLTITESGNYTSNNEFNGYSINVDVEGPKPEETLTQTITENGSHVFNPSEGHVFNSASITVDVPQGITPTGTINISDNGTYDVTDKATAVVAVGGKDYRYKTGTPDVAGLTAIGWDADSIGYYGANNPHYAWENDNYKVSQENIDLYSLDDPNPDLYKNNPNVTFVPNKNMSTYFGVGAGAFSNMKYIKSIPWYNTSNVTSMGYMFESCLSLQTIPPLDTSNVADMGSMFKECESLTSIPQLDTSKVTDMYQMFHTCKFLQSIPQLNTSKVTKMNYMFKNCSNLTSIPPLDTSNVADMGNMFNSCSSLQTIPQLDTSKVTKMDNMFQDCSSLTSIPQLNTSKVVDMSHMFQGCSKLLEVTLDQSSLGTHASGDVGYNSLFYGCSALQRVTFIGKIPESESRYMSAYSMFMSCSNLRSVTNIDFTQVTRKPDYFFGWNAIKSLTHFIVSGSINFSWSDDYGFYQTPNLDYESIKSILEAMNRTTNTNAKEMRFNQVMIDQGGELAGLVASCATKGWTVTGLTIKEQSMINSITPNLDHIQMTDIANSRATLTVNANEAWVGGGCPGRHETSNYFWLEYAYYNAATDELIQKFDPSNTQMAFNPGSGSPGETIVSIPGNYAIRYLKPKSGEYALVGITFKTTSTPHEYVDYYFKVYPDGE